MRDWLAECGVDAIAIIDDDESIRRALVRIIGVAGFDARPFSSAQEFLSDERCRDISCVVSDLRMPGVDGLALQRTLSERLPHVAMVFITGHPDLSAGVHAMKAGAVDFLEKPVRRADLLDAIDRATQSSHAARSKAAELAELDRRLARLTPRERDVFGLVAAGLLNKQIAGELGVAEKTIKQHRGVVMEKMEAESLADLVLMGERLGVRTTGIDLAKARGRIAAS